MNVSLSMTDDQHTALRAHLFPGDDLEAVALLLCGRRAGRESHRLLVREIHPVAHADCRVRSPDQIVWNPEQSWNVLERARQMGWTVVKVHSHPTAVPRFSATDDDSDREMLPILRAWGEDESLLSGSAVMLPSGRMFGRFLTAEGALRPLDAVQVVGPDIHRWVKEVDLHPATASHVAAFGEDTFQQFASLSIAVVGCSGTGAPLIEQLARLGPRELILVDPDIVEERNLNRITHATQDDVRAKRAKVEVAARAIRAIGLATHVRTVQATLWSRRAIQAVAEADVVFGCVDSIDGRSVLNRLAAYYLLPYFDVGVRLDAVPLGPARGNIRAVCGSVHYLRPGGSSLISRGLFTAQEASQERLAQQDPNQHAQLVKDGYIRGVPTSRPAVVSLNTQLAAMAVTELIARLHPFRDDPNAAYDQVELDAMDMLLFKHPHPTPCTLLAPVVGLGDVNPILELYSGLEA